MKGIEVLDLSWLAVNRVHYGDSSPYKKALSGKTGATYAPRRSADTKTRTGRRRHSLRRRSESLPQKSLLHFHPVSRIYVQDAF